MNRHLSAREISEWMMGERSAAMEQHARECPACEAELTRFGMTLGLFRESARQWADQQSIPETRTMLRIRQAPYYAMLRTFCWAAIVVIICTVGAVSTRRRLVPQAAVEAADSDAVLLQRVDMEISRTAPASLGPLDGLTPWQ